MNDTLNFIKKHKFIAILRNIPEEKLENTAKALYDGGYTKVFLMGADTIYPLCPGKTLK